MTAAAPTALLLGDSNMYGAFGHMLQRQLRALGYRARIIGRPGSGLARPDYYDWPTIGKQLVDKYRPRLVIIILGGNDGQRMRDAEGSYKDGIPWSDVAAWNLEYRRRLARLASALTSGTRAGERHVFVLSPTNRRPARARARVQRIVDVQRRALGARKDVRWVNAYDLSSDRQGQYLKYATGTHGKTVKLRRRDGIHLSQHGAHRLTYALYPLLAPALAEPP